ncbi:MAG: reverse transcriptase-like protein, partial [Parcubacteria group bacterium]|nr:reverse transcriptase-like protein [Parcubacteria group bacterium]
TNNEAEYEAVVLGLKKIRARYGKKKTKQMRILCTLDSELVVKQLNHEYKIQDAKIQPLFIAVWNLLLDFGSVTFRHVPRSHTTDADRLVNETLDSQARTLF